MAEQPGSAERKGGRGLSATLQITNHVLRQQETGELSRRAEEEKRPVKILWEFPVYDHERAVKHPSVVSWTRTKLRMMGTLLRVFYHLAYVM